MDFHSCRRARRAAVCIDEDDFETSGLYGAPRAQLAGHGGDFAVDALAGASNPAYLEETSEVQITAAIEAKAAALDHDPVAIHAWVRNNVAWIPSWGATQSADHTLSSQRGNAMDIASLEIALLRASDIPARYAVGTIEVEAERFTNWAGGFDTIEAAADYAASGGLPIETITEAGRIERVRMEHVWVEAALDYFPSRAAVNKAADAWIPLDASFKQYDFLEGLDVAAVTGLDPKKIADDFAASGTIDEQGGFVEGLDPTILQNAQNDAQAALEDHIQNELPDDATVADVIGGRQIRSQQFETLPASIPNRLVTTGARYDALPQDLQHRLVVGLDTDIFGNPTNAVRLPWAQVNGAPLSLTFSPASDADRQALKSLIPEGEFADPSQLTQSISSSLVRLVPELRLDGEVIKTGRAMKPGSTLDLAFKVKRRGFGPDTNVSQVPAGSYLNLAVAGGSVPRSRLERVQAEVRAVQDKLQSGNIETITSLTRHELLGSLFHSGALAYFSQFDALARIQARQQNTRQNLAPSVGTYGYVPKVATLFGLPNAIEPGSVEMDLDRVAWTQGAKETSRTTRVQRNIQAGALSSVLEHTVPQQMFSTENKSEQAVSAAKALQIAQREGQKIYRIDQSNRTAILPRLNLSPNTTDEIRSALDAGKVVTTHPDKVSVPGWQGAGYVILDPDTGAGAWKIGGGTNGGSLPFLMSLLLASFGGFFEGLSGELAEDDLPLAKAKSVRQWKIARVVSSVGKLLGAVGLVIDIVASAVDNSLSLTDKIGRIFVAFLGYSLSTWLIAGVVATFTAGVAAIIAPLLAVTVGIVLADFAAIYFSTIRINIRYALMRKLKWKFETL